MELSVIKGYGYWNLNSYSWGESFHRFKDDMVLEVTSVKSKYNNGSPKEVYAKTSDGKKVGVIISGNDVKVMEEFDMTKAKKFINDLNEFKGSWKVFINGKDSGVVETNYEWASKHYANQAKLTGKKIELRLNND